MRSKHLTTLIGLIVIAALFFSGGRPAAAQDGGGVGAQVDPPCNGSVLPPSSGVLCSQMDLGGGTSSAVSSQNNFNSDKAYCESNFLPIHCLDSDAADDFVVPTGNGVLSWIINKVEITGSYLAPSAYKVISVNVKFFRSTGALPGSLAYQDSYVPPEPSLSSGSFVINLTRPAALQTGQSYWVEVQANLDLAGQSHQWYWGQRTVQGGNNPSAWLNALDGSTRDCTTWKPRVSGCGIGDQPDLLFKLSGNTNNNLLFLPLVSR